MPKVKNPRITPEIVCIIVCLESITLDHAIMGTIIVKGIAASFMEEIRITQSPPAATPCPLIFQLSVTKYISNIVIRQQSAKTIKNLGLPST